MFTADVMGCPLLSDVWVQPICMKMELATRMKQRLGHLFVSSRADVL